MMTEKTAAVFAAATAAVIVFFLTGCAGFEVRIGGSTYNRNHETRSYVDPEQSHRNVGGKDIGAY